MFLSIFEIFKVGIGPSSSHTMGPMFAALRFLQLINEKKAAQKLARISCHFYGSLAFTGKGHGSDRAVILGLSGFSPDNIDVDQIADIEEKVKAKKRISPVGGLAINDFIFDYDRDIVFDYDKPLPLHSNGMIFKALDDSGAVILEQTYYSTGGGFVYTDDELKNKKAKGVKKQDSLKVPFPFATADEMLEMGKRSGKSVFEMKKANELVFMSEKAFTAKVSELWNAMNECIDRGLSNKGILPGGLKVNRRAKELKKKIEEEIRKNDAQPHIANDWLSLYAIAVNEENAAGGRIVTSPTNGAAGVIPAVLRYYLDHCIGSSAKNIETYLLSAAAIGGLIKHNASISGAEVGCQGEVGSASSMAAAGLCSAMGGSNEQVENAAEIALEHHLGMTCDPVGGLVQIPCIERNGLGAIKAVSASSLALHGDGKHFISLDKCIKTMLNTGRDMNDKYKETSKGGLALNLPAC